MRLKVLSPVAMILAAGSTLMAQEMIGTVTGTVRGQDGAVVAGATVKVASEKTLTSRVVTTDAQGQYRVSLLLPGEYTAVVSKEGMIGAKAEFRVMAGQVVRQDIVIRPMQAAGATVEIVAASSAVDKTQTKTATSATMEEISEIPTANLFAIKALAPLSIAPSVNASNPYYAAVRGGAQGQTQYLVNGLSVRDNITSQGRPHDVILDDLVEESQVILSPLNAKYGDSSAGLINIIEKTGSNEFAGTLRVKLDKPSWTARRPLGYTRSGNVANTAEAPFTDSLSRVYEMSISGPIIKDRFTFTYGTRSQPASLVSRQAGSLASAPNTFFNTGAVAAQLWDQAAARSIAEKFTFHQGRLFLQITPSHTLDYSHSENFNQYADWGNGANTSSVDLGIGPNQTSSNRFRQLTYRGLFGANQIVEVRYGRRQSDIQFVSGPGDPILLRWGSATMTSLLQASTSFYANGGLADSQPEKRDTDSFFANYSTTLDWGGQHNIDAGVNWIKTKWGTVQNSGGPNGRVFQIPGQALVGAGAGDRTQGFIVFNYNDTINGVNYYNTSAYRTYIPTMVEYIGVEQATLEKPVTSLYVNDLWTINNNWSVMLGLRHESYKYSDGNGEKYNSSTLSPRFEVKYDLEGNNKRVVNFSYGQFRGNVHERITRGFSQFRHTTVVTRFWNQNPGSNTMSQVSLAEVTNPANYGYVYAYDVPSAIYAIDPNFKPDVNHEFTLGYRRSYSSGGSFSATLVSRTWKDLPMSFGGTDLITIQDPTGSGLPSKTNYLRTLANDPDSKRHYSGLELEWKNIPIIPSRLIFNGSYTYSRTTGTNPLQDSTGWNSSLANAGWFRPQLVGMGVSRDSFDPEGQLPTSGGNAVRMLLTYHANVGATHSSVTLMGNYDDGVVENRTTNSVAMPSPLNSAIVQLPTSYTTFWNGRGQFSQPPTTRFDLAYNLDIPIRKKVTFFTTMTVTNVFNTIRRAYTYWSNSGTVQAAPGAGYRINTANTAYYGAAPNYSYYTGGRNFGLDLGIRF